MNKRSEKVKKMTLLFTKIVSTIEGAIKLISPPQNKAEKKVLAEFKKGQKFYERFILESDAMALGKDPSSLLLQLSAFPRRR